MIIIFCSILPKNSAKPLFYLVEWLLHNIYSDYLTKVVYIFSITDILFMFTKALVWIGKNLFDLLTFLGKSVCSNLRAFSICI